MRRALAVPLCIDSPLAPDAARAALAASLDAMAAELRGHGTGRLPLFGRVTGDAVVLARVQARANRYAPTLRGRLEPRPGGGTRLVAAVAPMYGDLTLPLFGATMVAIAAWARVPWLALVGLVVVVLGAHAFWRAPAHEAERLRRVLEPLLQALPADAHAR